MVTPTLLYIYIQTVKNNPTLSKLFIPPANDAANNQYEEVDVCNVIVIDETTHESHTDGAADF